MEPVPFTADDRRMIEQAHKMLSDTLKLLSKIDTELDALRAFRSSPAARLMGVR